MRRSLIFTENILPVAEAWLREGRAPVLLTLVGVEGSSPRPVGSQMVVASDGECAGYITAGCVEAALVAEAEDVRAKGSGRTVRYGAGSPYLDIDLPCGSGIDVHFEPCLKLELLTALNARLRQRQTAQMVLDCAHERAPQMEPFDGGVVRAYAPRQRLIVAGKGVVCVHMASMAKDIDLEVCLASPDADVLEAAERSAAHSKALKAPGPLPADWVDPACAVITLFHDHEWEPPILAQAMDAGAFYIGAMGSRHTHALRCEILREMGYEDHAIKNIYGPVGLDIGAQNPAQIALSAAAQIIARMNGRPI